MSIEVNDVSLTYINKKVDITIPNGLVYIAGKNGTGKTLLLDTVAGLTKSKGKIAGNNDVIYINQSTYFSDKLKVKDLLEFTYFLDGNLRKKSDFILFLKKILSDDQISEIAELLDKRWGILSGGERKYIYAIIVLSISKEWYIMDEPFAYIDDEKKKILMEIIRLRLNEGKNVIITSHEYIEEMNELHPEKIEIN